MSTPATGPRKYVRVEYHVRGDVDLDELKRAIARFVTGIREHGADHLYTSYQDVEDPRDFVHVGDFAADAVPRLQAPAFFAQVTAFRRERCVVGPEATMLAKIASTR